jgi:hypothetical protein
VIAIAGYLIFQLLSVGSTTPPVEQVTVPNFVGQTLDDARVTADPLGLELVPTAQESDQPIGTILSQEPAPDTKVDTGAQVTVVVATGTETVAVPDLRLRTEADAVAAIVGAGLTNGTRAVAFDPVAPAGTVVSQDPQAGVRVARGTPVNYIVSTGPEPTPAPTPDRRRRRTTPTRARPRRRPLEPPTPVPTRRSRRRRLSVSDARRASQQMAADGSPSGRRDVAHRCIRSEAGSSGAVPTPGEARPQGPRSG